MNVDKLISVIVTAYNVEKYISDCLNSVLEQSYVNIEVLVVDDGSTDNTAAIIKNKCLRDKRISYIYQENAGVSVARNIGITASKGSFIMFVDGDDCLQNNIIEKLYSNIDSQTDIASCCCVGFNSENSYVEHFFDKDYSMKSIDEKERLYLQLMKTECQQPEGQKIFTAIGVPWGKLYRRKLLEDNGLRFNPQLRRMQDNVFNMYAFQCAKQVKYINEPLYQYRLDHIAGYKKAYSPDAYYKVLVERRKFFNENPDYCTPQMSKAYLNECADYYMMSIKNICLTKTFDVAAKDIDELNHRDIYVDSILNDNIRLNKKLRLTQMIINAKMLWILYAYFKLKK